MPTKAAPKKNLSALKRARQARKRYERNKAVKTRIKNLVKKVQAAVAEGNPEATLQALREAQKIIYRAATRGIIHSNTAARKVSKITKLANKVLAKSEAA